MGMIMHDDVPYGEGTSYTQGTGIAINNNVIAVDADNTPTSGSEKPVKSKGVYEVVEQIYADNGVLGAKNLLPNNATSQTKNGVAFTVNADGSVTANGTATASTDLIVSRDLPLLYGGRYILSGCPSNGAVSKYRITAYRVDSIDGQSGSLFDIGEGIEFTYKNMTGNAMFIIYIENGVTVDNLIFYPMLRLASDPDDTYVPYAMTNRELTENIRGLKVYTAGDTINCGVSLLGHITTGTTTFELSLRGLFDKNNIRNIAASGTVLVRGGNGYIKTSNNVELNNVSFGTYLKVSESLVNPQDIIIRIKQIDDTAFANVDNNTIIDIQGLMLTLS